MDGEETAQGLPLLKGVPKTPDLEAAIGRYRGTRVYAPWAGKTLFDQFGRFDLDLKRELPPGDLDHGLIVVSFPHSTKPRRLPEVFAELRGVWTEELRRAAAAGRVRIVLDASPEGYRPTAYRLQPIHEGLESLGAPVEAGGIFTQDRGYGAEYARYLSERGVANGLRVLNYDFWIRRFHDQFERRGARLYPKRLAAFEAKPKARGRRFVSLNMALRPSKLLFLLSVIRDGLWDLGYISCGGLFKKPSQFDTEDLNLSEGDFARKLSGSPFEALAKELLPYFPELESKGQIILGDVNREGPNGWPKQTPIAPLIKEYDDSWFTAVTETEMRSRRTRITEKPFAALVNFHPLVMFGNPGALAQLRDFGYRTFGEAIDESYDEIEDPGRRFAAAYKQFQRLCRLDETELASLEQRLRGVLVFNAEWGMTRLPRIYRDRIDLAFMDELFGAPAWA